PATATRSDDDESLATLRPVPDRVPGAAVGMRVDQDGSGGRGVAYPARLGTRRGGPRSARPGSARAPGGPDVPDRVFPRARPADRAVARTGPDPERRVAVRRGGRALPQGAEVRRRKRPRQE